MKNGLFIKTFLYGVAGACIGLLCGLIFALIVVSVSSLITATEAEDLLEAIPTLGMGAGSVIGAVLGAITALKKQ
jgi:TM2 domain-containing membrane protein YozV